MDDIKVLTLNTWGLLYVSKDVEIRMEHIGSELAKGEYDIVALQEVWSLRHYESIVEKVKEKLPYAYYFHSGVIGSGCATFSKYPIIDTFYHKYMHNGYFWDIFHGDWFAGKGVGCAIIKHPKKDIHVFNTHLHASYTNDTYDECRALQMYQITQTINKTTRRGDAIILCGDFNNQPDELGVTSLADIAHIQDTYDVATQKPSPCYTCNCNVYKNAKEYPQRIDYIFMGDVFECSECHLAMQDIPDTGLFYSDHDGYAVTLHLKQEASINLCEKTAHHSIQSLKRLYDVIFQGEQLSEEIAWGKLSFLFLLISLLIVLPLLSMEHFHSYVTTTHLNTWNGKFIFAIQALLIGACMIYAWIVLIIRKIDVKSFKNVSSEIQLKIKYLSQLNNKKV